jgi:UDP-N-acetyl-D-mannosaminuronate dehydrogenase
MNDKTVCVGGIGYVGLPLAEAFAQYDLQTRPHHKG